MAFSLGGRVALVTGSSTGLGKGTAGVLGQAGAKVAVNYFNNQERGEAAIIELREAGCECALFRGDVSQADAVDRIFSEIEQQLGAVDVVVVNATPDQPELPIEEYDWELYQSMLDFFVRSPYLLARRCLPAMKEKKWGRIINITSEVYHASTAPFSAYVAAKGGQIGWTRSMSKELAPYGITVNSVAPGWIPTQRHADASQEAKDRYISQVPAARWGTYEDVGNAVLYFASEEAAYVTGQTLCVNGGKTPW